MEKLIEGGTIQLKEVAGGPVRMWQRLDKEETQSSAASDVLALDALIGSNFADVEKASEHVSKELLFEREQAVDVSDVLTDSKVLQTADQEVQRSIDEINRFIGEESSRDSLEVHLIPLQVF